MSGARQVKVLYDERSIAERTEALAREIAAAEPKDLLVVAILKGSFMFAADLLRALHRVGLEPHVEFFHLSSYLAGKVSSGVVTILRDIESSVKDRDILLIDDILESGRTLAYAKDLLVARGARRVLVCALLQKPGKREVDVEADFIGFVCPICSSSGLGWTARMRTASCRSSAMSSRPRRSDERRSFGAIRKPVPIVRQPRRPRARRRADASLARGTRQARAGGIHRAPRRPTPERKRSGIGRTPALAHRIFRIGRLGDRASGQGRAVRG